MSLTLTHRNNIALSTGCSVVQPAVPTGFQDTVPDSTCGAFRMKETSTTDHAAISCYRSFAPYHFDP